MNSLQLMAYSEWRTAHGVPHTAKKKEAALNERPLCFGGKRDVKTSLGKNHCFKIKIAS